MRVLLPLLFCSLAFGQDVVWPPLPDPAGLGPRLTVVAWLRDHDVTAPAGITDRSLVILYERTRSPGTDEEREKLVKILRADGQEASSADPIEDLRARERDLSNARRSAAARSDEERRRVREALDATNKDAEKRRVAETVAAADKARAEEAEQRDAARKREEQRQRAQQEKVAARINGATRCSPGYRLQWAGDAGAVPADARDWVLAYESRSGSDSPWPTGGGLIITSESSMAGWMLEVPGLRLSKQEQKMAPTQVWTMDLALTSPVTAPLTVRMVDATTGASRSWTLSPVTP